MDHHQSSTHSESPWLGFSSLDGSTDGSPIQALPSSVSMVSPISCRIRSTEASRDCCAGVSNGSEWRRFNPCRDCPCRDCPCRGCDARGIQAQVPQAPTATAIMMISWATILLDATDIFAQFLLNLDHGTHCHHMLIIFLQLLLSIIGWNRVILGYES
jgi:hypothetical protein